MNDWLNYVNLVLLFSIFAVSLNLLLGYAGILSAGQAALGAMGGYTTAWVTTSWGWNPWLGVLLGVFIASLVGLLLAIPSLPLPAEYVILLTLVAGEALIGLAIASPVLGGVFGIQGVPAPSIFGVELARAVNWVLPLLVGAVVVYLICWRIGESPFGRVLRATRDDERAASSIGKHVFRFRLWTFVITAAMAGFAGGLFAVYLGISSPTVYGFDVSMGIFAMVVLGGVANLPGSVLGAILVVFSTPILQRLLDLPPERESFVRIAIYGLLLVIFIRFRPQGLLPERHARSAKKIASVAVEATHQTDRHDVADSQEVVLQTHGLTRHFGGVVAAEDLSIALRKGTITALVGPNGAGKTTVFNLLTGYLRPDRGNVLLYGTELGGLRPDEIALNGMVRTFQDVRIWPGMSVLDNVAIAIPHQEGEHIGRLFVPGRQVARHEEVVLRQALEWLSFVGLEDVAADPAGVLSYGQTKLLSLARVMATNAPVVLLDEPISGVDTAWADRMLALVEQMRNTGRTICLVEHNLHVVDRLASRAYFMDLGRIIAEGTLSELTSSPELAKTYFGLRS